MFVQMCMVQFNIFNSRDQHKHDVWWTCCFHHPIERIHAHSHTYWDTIVIIRFVDDGGLCCWCWCIFVSLDVLYQALKWFSVHLFVCTELRYVKALRSYYLHWNLKSRKILQKFSFIVKLTTDFTCHSVKTDH